MSEQNNEQSTNPFIQWTQQLDAEMAQLGLDDLDNRFAQSQVQEEAERRIRKENITDESEKLKIYQEVKAQYKEYEGYLRKEHQDYPRSKRVPESSEAKKIDITKEQLIERINHDFVYHAPHGDQVERYASLRETARQFATKIVQDTPVSREQSLALTKLEEAAMWANAAIARNEKPGEGNGS